MTDPQASEPFDQHARGYDDELNRGLRVSGETKEFFAERRIAWLATRCEQLRFRPRIVLDYGCGSGGTTKLLFSHLGAASVIGLDVSTASLEIARRTNGDLPIRFLAPGEYTPDGSVDLVFVNGVFHHIPPHERRFAVGFIAECLRRDGLMAFWENNPLNPGTRYVMSKIPFDKDAITLRSGEAKSLLRSEGFEVINTDYHFIFPRALKFLRGLEPYLARVPIGAQYQVLCRKR
jgi:SAM-dependent methyltransferase